MCEIWYLMSYKIIRLCYYDTAGRKMPRRVLRRNEEVVCVAIRHTGKFGVV